MNRQFLDIEKGLICIILLFQTVPWKQLCLAEKEKLLPLVQKQNW